MTADLSALIARLEAGPVYLTHKEAYDLAVFFGSDTALGMASLIRKAFVGGSLDAALALAERVHGEARALDLLQDVLSLHDASGLAIRDLPRLLCSFILRARQGEGE